MFRSRVELWRAGFSQSDPASCYQYSSDIHTGNCSGDAREDGGGSIRGVNAFDCILFLLWRNSNDHVARAPSQSINLFSHGIADRG